MIRCERGIDFTSILAKPITLVNRTYHIVVPHHQTACIVLHSIIARRRSARLRVRSRSAFDGGNYRPPCDSRTVVRALDCASFQNTHSSLLQRAVTGNAASDSLFVYIGTTRHGIIPYMRAPKYRWDQRIISYPLARGTKYQVAWTYITPNLRQILPVHNARYRTSTFVTTATAKRNRWPADVIFTAGDVYFKRVSNVNGGVSIQETLRHIVLPGKKVVTHTQFQLPWCYRQPATGTSL